MKIDRLVNFFLAAFGRTSLGDLRLRFHSQNLNEDGAGRPKGFPREGRSWLHFSPRGFSAREFRFEWNLWTHFCGISLKRCGDSGGLTFHIAFPPFSFWLTLPLGRPRWSSHGVIFDLAVHDSALWWQFGGNSMEWSSRTSKWKHGSFNVADFLLGRTQFSQEVLSTHQVLIPMPEGGYPATVVLERCTWKRPRWFALVKPMADVKIPKGIPHQGKGENSYDCGEDRLFGLSRSASTIEQAIAGTVESALRSRRRYDGNAMAQYPAPVV